MLLLSNILLQLHLMSTSLLLREDKSEAALQNNVLQQRVTTSLLLISFSR
jgi:hypothetical protein